MNDRFDMPAGSPLGAPSTARADTPGMGESPTTAATLHATSGPESHAAPGDGEDASPSADEVRLALRRVKDPDLNLNIIDLGLVYDVRVVGSVVDVDMSLTSPGCPSGAELTAGAEQAARGVPGVTDVNVRIVWDPMWTPDRIEPRVRAYLGF